MALIELLLILIHLFYSAVYSRETEALYIHRYFRNIDRYMAVKKALLTFFTLSENPLFLVKLFDRVMKWSVSKRFFEKVSGLYFLIDV